MSAKVALGVDVAVDMHDDDVDTLFVERSISNSFWSRRGISVSFFCLGLR